ncbi:MAG: adenosylmethionine--8-amino-7-oxononanoate transaminase, partial [Chitinophagaceae bacterium]
QPAIELAENLLTILPPNQSKIFYSDNGSTATEVAIKMAIQYWHNTGLRKNKIIAFEHSYHGDTFGAMSISSRSTFTNPFEGLLFDVIHIPLPVAGQQEETIQFCLRVIEENKNEIAAFIFEPLVLGAGGMLMYEASVLNKLLKICKESSILTIADEVMTGFGRTGKYFACGYLNHNPDIICLSKGITGGTMALGVTSCTADIFNAFLSNDRAKTFFHGHSYTANPVACAAAIASFELLIKEECLQNIKRIEDLHLSFITKNRKNTFIKNLRSRGTILAMDFGTDEKTSYFNPLRDRLYAFFLKKGIILRPLGNTVYVMPPYCISNNDLQLIYSSLEQVNEIL